MDSFGKANATVYAETHEVEFVYFVYGYTPEFMPHIATRRDKHFKVADKKIIRCPHCRDVFRVVDKTERVELYRRTTKAKGRYHASLPCQSCHSKVGVIYASA